jgi:hypothetical protein
VVADPQVRELRRRRPERRLRVRADAERCACRARRRGRRPQDRPQRKTFKRGTRSTLFALVGVAADEKAVPVAAEVLALAAAKAAK